MNKRKLIKNFYDFIINVNIQLNKSSIINKEKCQLLNQKILEK